MLPTVTLFLQTNRDLVNQFKFEELYSHAKSYFDSPNQMAELWQSLKSVKAPLSYSDILPGYEKYEDLNDTFIRSSDLDKLNTQVEINLPDMTFHEILKIVRELFPNVLDRRRVEMLLQKTDTSCSYVKLTVSPNAISSRCKIQISYIQLGTVIDQVIPLETVLKNNLDYIPGLCIAYKSNRINASMRSIEEDILDVLKMVREGKL